MFDILEEKESNYSSDMQMDTFLANPELSSLKINFTKTNSVEIPQRQSFRSSTGRSPTFNKSYSIVQEVYTPEEIIRMKNRMIDYLKSENDRLSSEIQKGGQDAYSVPNLIKKPTGYSVPVGHLVIACFVAIILGFVAGSR